MAAEGGGIALRRRLLRLPRGVYWIVGAAIGACGALAARLLADGVDEAWRVPVWLAGGAMIFFGLAVLSLGTKARLSGGEDGGAGEGNRTLA